MSYMKADEAENTVEKTTQEESTAESSDLEINLDILSKQKDTVTYLGDLYGYQVFSNEFENAINKVNAEKKEEIDSSFNYILNCEPEPVVDNAFNAVITGEAQVVIKNEYNKNETSMSTGMIIGCVLLGMILTAVFLIVIDKKRKEKSLNENNNNNFGSYFE